MVQAGNTNRKESSFSCAQVPSKKFKLDRGGGCIFPPDWPKSFAMSILSNIAEGKNSEEYCQMMLFVKKHFNVFKQIIL